MTPTIDQQDRDILTARMAAFDADTRIRVGDFARFACGTIRRVSHIWRWDLSGGATSPNTLAIPDRDVSVQTSDTGSYYLGSCYVSMSGGLHPGLPLETFALTDETMDGDVWFFHHDHHKADNGVHFTVPFRVWACNQEANK